MPKDKCCSSLQELQLVRRTEGMCAALLNLPGTLATLAKSRHAALFTPKGLSRDYAVCFWLPSSFSFVLTHMAMRRKQELFPEALKSPSRRPKLSWSSSRSSASPQLHSPRLPWPYQTSCETQSQRQVQGDQSSSGQRTQAGGSQSGWAASELEHSGMSFRLGRGTVFTSAEVPRDELQ